MAPKANPLQNSQSGSRRPAISTYDSGYEHSLEHLFEIQNMVAQQQEDDQMPQSASIVAKAS